MRLVSLMASLIATAPAAMAQTIGAAEFEALSTGKTQYFSSEGQFFGAEQFFEGRRTRWMHADGTCSEGRWYPKGEAICFVYEDDPEEHCWVLRQNGSGFSAQKQMENGFLTGEIVLSQVDEEPLNCPGPDLGV